MSDPTAEEVIAEALPMLPAYSQDRWESDAAEYLLQALQDAGFTVARLEQVKPSQATLLDAAGYPVYAIVESK